MKQKMWMTLKAIECWAQQTCCAGGETVAAQGTGIEDVGAQTSKSCPQLSGGRALGSENF